MNPPNLTRRFSRRQAAMRPSSAELGVMFHKGSDVQKWRNWGDHPVIVAVGVIAAIATVVGTLKSCELAPSIDPTRTEPTTTSKDVKPRDYRQEASDSHSKLYKEYVALRDDPNASEKDIALKRLEALQAERHWMMWVRLDDKRDFKTEEERTWAIYGELISEQEMSTDEHVALLAVKKHDAEYFRRLDGERRVKGLEESLARMATDIKNIEATHPTFWRRMHVTHGIDESPTLPKQEHNNPLESTSGR